MSRSLDLALDIAAEIAKTKAGREALGILASVLAGSFFGRPCPHPWMSLVWISEKEAICGKCGRRFKRHWEGK